MTSGPRLAGQLAALLLVAAGCAVVPGAAVRHHRPPPARPSIAAPGTTATPPRRAIVPRVRRVAVAVPVLMYHVIASAPPGAPYPGLYVPASEFAAQMHALRRAGFHAVTLDQMRAFWLHGTPLPHGRPIVLTFDNGYRSQYTEALPILRRMHWVGDLNLQLAGLPPALGGLGRPLVRALVRAGWELDSQTYTHPDLVTLAGAALRHQVAGARRELRRLYHVPALWFCYPSGDYSPAVIAAVRAAGFVGATTTVPGWAHAGDDPFRTERLRVLAGTSGQALLALLSANRHDPPPPAAAG
ncbi:MAG TPA: polysaccharide deacetylase family protein [Gaiellales bacterium]|nr:polysaccharide deacetylase family protein [Gaiellales bacterium]